MTLQNLSLSFVLFSFLLLSACQSPSQDTSGRDTTQQEKAENASSKSINQVLPVAEFEALLKQKTNAQLLDVRTAEEVQGGSIDGALNYDFYQKDFKEKLNLLDPQKPVFVYCKSGGRSGKTSRILQKTGFTEIYDLEGGYTAWSAKH